MGQQLQQDWRSAEGEKLWLSMLVDAMEQVSRPELRSQPCDRLVVAAVCAQLSRPAAPYPIRGPVSACVTNFDRPAEPAYSPAICSRGRWPRSTPRSLASSSPM